VSLTPFAPVVLPPQSTARPVITPRPGESLTFAIFRELDPFHGTGLSATDQTVTVAEGCDQLRQALADAGRRNAELLVQRRADVATIHQLQQSLAEAYQLIHSLQEQLEEATANAASDADAAAGAVAYTLYVESH